jgi:hypothetical protein
MIDEFMGCPGLEPGTNRLKAEYSTIELATLTYGYGHKDSQKGCFCQLSACFFQPLLRITQIN